MSDYKKIFSSKNYNNIFNNLDDNFSNQDFNFTINNDKFDNRSIYPSSKVEFKRIKLW